MVARTIPAGARAHSVHPSHAAREGADHAELPGDVSGTVEAVVQALRQLKSKDISFRVLHSGVGDITDADVSLAAASKGALGVPRPDWRHPPH